MESTGLALRRQVQRARYRHAWWTAVVAGLGGNALLVLGLWAAAPRAEGPDIAVMPAQVSAPPAPAPIVVTPPMVPPMIVVVTPPPPTAGARGGDLGPCPAPHTARPSGGLRQPDVDGQLVGFNGSPSDSRLVAVWTADRLLVSRDGGASWDRVLDGPGGIVDATFDCHGRALVLRTGAGLGVRDGAREAWRPVPNIVIDVPADEHGRYQPRLVGGGRSIAVVGTRGEEFGQGYAALSDDGGESWRFADLGWYEGDRIAAAWDGGALDVVVPWTDCSWEGLRRATVTASGVKEHGDLAWARQIALDGARIHGVSWDCPQTPDTPDEGLCTWRDGHDWRPVAPPRAAGSADATTGDDAVELTLVDGPVDVVVREHQVHAIRGAHLGRGRAWPAEATPLGTDRAGRLWGLEAGHTLIRR